MNLLKIRIYYIIKMEEEKYCSMCKGKLKDGEIVAISDEGYYYHAYSNATSLGSELKDCATKNAIIIPGTSIEKRKIYYKGNFHDLKKLDNLEKINLIRDLNDYNNGDIIKGNLELLSKLPLL